MELIMKVSLLVCSRKLLYTVLCEFCFLKRLHKSQILVTCYTCLDIIVHHLKRIPCFLKVILIHGLHLLNIGCEIGFLSLHTALIAEGLLCIPVLKEILYAAVIQGNLCSLYHLRIFLLKIVVWHCKCDPACQLIDIGHGILVCHYIALHRDISK